MLTVRDVIDINYIPAATEISLDLLKESLMPETNGRDLLDYYKVRILIL